MRTVPFLTGGFGRKGRRKLLAAPTGCNCHLTPGARPQDRGTGGHLDGPRHFGPHLEDDLRPLAECVDEPVHEHRNALGLQALQPEVLLGRADLEADQGGRGDREPGCGWQLVDEVQPDEVL